MSDSAASAAPVPINVWLANHPIPHFLDPVAEAAESFNRAHPGYEVRIREVAYTDMAVEVARAVEEGAPPELAEYYFTAVQLALDMRAQNGRPLFTPIQRAIGDRTKILGEPVVIDDLVPAVRAYYSPGGELVAMPAMASTAIMFANRDLLRRAGVERMPMTWREFEAACVKVSQLPDGPPNAASWPNHGWLFQMEAGAQGALICDNDNGRAGRATRITLHSPEILEYVRWWQRLHEAGHYLYTGEPRDFMGPMGKFAGQELAFVVSSSAVGPIMAHMAAEAGFELTAGPLPHNGDERYAGRLLGGQSLYLTADLPKEKEDGALAFLQHLLNPRNAVLRQRAGGTLPVTVPAREQSAGEGWFEQHPYFRAAVDQVDASDGTPAATGPVVGDLNGIQDVLTAAMHDVLTAGADPRARFAAATAEAQGLLDRHNAACLADPPVTPDTLAIG